MHFLKEVSPAATSCARAPWAAANEVTATNRLNVNFFMGCSFGLIAMRRGNVFRTRSQDQTSRQKSIGFTTACILDNRPSVADMLLKMLATCLICPYNRQPRTTNGVTI